MGISIALISARPSTPVARLSRRRARPRPLKLLDAVPFAERVRTAENRAQHRSGSRCCKRRGQELEANHTFEEQGDIAVAFSDGLWQRHPLVGDGGYCAAGSGFTRSRVRLTSSGKESSVEPPPPAKRPLSPLRRLKEISPVFTVS